MSNKQTHFWKRRRKRFSRKLSLLFVPHKDNHYRPHLVRRYGLLAIVGLVVGLQFGYNFTQTGSVLGRVTTVTPAALLAGTNDQRLSHHVSTLSLDTRLSTAAKEKAQDMLTKGYWSHTAPDGTEPWTWIEQSGYTYQDAGENLAKNFTTAQATIAAWMDSSAHRDNLLNEKYRDVGFAIVNGDIDGKPTTIVVALYATPARLGASEAPVGLVATNTGQVTPLSFAGRVGVMIQSLTPAALTSLALLFIAVTVAIVAHFYRSQLPKRLQKSWYKHHGVIKASGLLTVAAFIVLLYGGGTI